MDLYGTCEMFVSVYSVGMCVFCGFEVDVSCLFHGYVLEPDFHLEKEKVIFQLPKKCLSLLFLSYVQ